MWSFFRSKPACPIDIEAARWIDARFAWLEQQFGPDTPRRVRVILPTPEFFPDPYNGEPEDLKTMLIRVAGYMNVDPERFELFHYSQAEAPSVPGAGVQKTSGAAGVYVHSPSNGPKGGRRCAIGIEYAQLHDPTSLVATLAHEICHELLLGEKRIDADAPDHEPLTDLLTVFLGFGIFTANATIRDKGWSDGMWAGWHTSRHGYLDQRMLGYALARFAIARAETDPSWARSVRPDVRVVIKRAIPFLANSETHQRA